VNLNESLVALNCSRLTFYGSRMSQSDSGWDSIAPGWASMTPR
jgi:hypothetical protein